MNSKKITSVGRHGEFDHSEREFATVDESKAWWSKHLQREGAEVTFAEDLDEDGDGTITVSREWPTLAAANRHDGDLGYIYIQERE